MRKGTHHSKETRQKISKANKGKHFSPKTEFKKGFTPWNKGKTAKDDSRIQEYGRKVSKAKKGKGHSHSRESKKKISQALRGKQFSNEHRQHLSESHKGIHHSMEARRKMSKQRKGRKFSAETKAKMSASKMGEKNPMFGKPGTFKGKYHSEESKAKIRMKRLKRVFPQKDTSIEVALQNELNRQGIVYEKHIPVCGTCQPDIIFLDEKIAVFCDGDYWHNRPEVKKRDKYQDKILVENGWRVYQFWGHEINSDSKSCADIILDELGVSSNA